MGEDAPGHSKVEIILPWRTILKILATAFLVYLCLRLWRLGEVLFLALLIAVAFRPFLEWTRKHRWPHWAAVLFCALLLLGSSALFIGLLVPTIATEGKGLIEKLPEFKEEIFRRVPPNGVVRASLDQILGSPAFSNPEPIVKRMVAWGSVALEAVTGFLVMLVLAIYFVAEGERVYNWLLAFLPEKHRKKMAQASEEITSVASHYMAGQFITSVLCAIYAFAVLKILGVPNAALLAVMAGIFDVLPLIGFFLFTIPAVAIAFTVSPGVAALVAVLYLAYHLLENYFIVPKVYGNRLRLSTLTVLIACLTAGLVAGVVGVIIVLPIIACYPILERIWLRPHLETDTVAKHEELDRKAET
jgi:predicted PurR-regulated permease PerM